MTVDKLQLADHRPCIHRVSEKKTCLHISTTWRWTVRLQ